MLEIVVFSLIILVFGVLPSIWYLNRKEKNDINKNPNRAVVILASLLVLINTSSAYIIGHGEIMFVLGYVYLLPAIAILFFLQNRKKMWNAVFFTSLTIFISILGNLLMLAGDMAKQGQT